jgi:nitrite reductase/ring-hydroxylating ferredoxin subunit
MSARDVRRFVEELLRGRRTRAFRPDDEDAAQMRAAIALRAGRPGSGAAGEEFVAGLHRRLAAELGEDEVAAARGSRRRVLQIGSVAAAAVAVGAVADHVIMTSGSPQATDSGTLTPTDGTWTRVAASTELPDGGVRPFDVDGVAGFVRRDGGRVAAVSGICTHQGCHLRLDAPARILRCPCHMTAFAVTGELVTHELPVAPRPLPRLEVRQNGDAIEVLTPPPSA